MDGNCSTMLVDNRYWVSSIASRPSSTYKIVVTIGGIPADTSELDIKRQEKLTLTTVKAIYLYNMGMIGKYDPYVIVYSQPLFNVKSKGVENNLNPVLTSFFLSLLLFPLVFSASNGGLIKV